MADKAMAETVYIGSGAGFAGDRLDAGAAVVETLKRRDGARYLIFEVMGERTLAIAQRIRMRDPDLGYSPYLASRGMKWIQHYGEPGLTDEELRDYLRESHRIVSLGLPKKTQRALGLNQPADG